MQKTIETITAEQADKMLDLMLGISSSPGKRMRGVRNRCMMMLMLDAGLRVGELVQLKRSDLMMNVEVVTSLRIRKEIAKGKTERLIPLSERLKISIEEMHRHLWKGVMDESALWVCSSVLFGPHISERQVERIIAKYSLLAFGESIHPHILRHTFATRLMACTSMRNVQVLLGHKNLQTTQVYTHPNDQDLKKAIDTMEKGTNNADKT